MADPNELSEEIQKLTATAKDLGEQMKEAATTDESRYNDLKAQLDKVTEDYKGLVNEQRKAEREAEADARLKRLEADLSAITTPSKAHLIGPGIPRSEGANADHFFATLASANSLKLAGSVEAMSAAKAALEEMGSTWQAPDPAAKATVGDTDAAGGYLVPNPVVADINLQATAPRSAVDLFDNVNGVRGSAVDIPWESEGITRAAIAAAGATKENSNFIVNNYTATLYTLARIFDVGNQLLRHSQGAAERLVRSKLARAFALGEDYYALRGSGSSEPYGLITALDNAGNVYDTSHTASNSTVAGSAIAAVLKAAGALADRGAVPDGVIMNSADFYTAWAQGTNEAGFFADPFRTINAVGVDTSGPGGLRWRHSPSMESDHLVVGEFSTVQFFRGDGYRVDTSSEAGDRWDKNLTGFRGEEEIAFDARPAVYTGKFQLIEDAVA